MKITDAELLDLQAEIEDTFPTVQRERPLYFVKAEEGARALVAARASEPESTIFVVGEVVGVAELKGLLHAGADGVFDPRDAEERAALMRAVAVHVARSERSRGGVVQACRALHSLLVEWNRRMVLAERAAA